MTLGNLPEKPNILILLNDQDTVALDWLPAFEDENMPTTQRLKKNGLTFTNNIIATCACSPARAALLTGRYPSENGVTQTLAMAKDKTIGKKQVGYTQNALKPSHLNIGHMLKAAGYNVIWKGKWHLSHPVNGTAKWTEKDIERMESAYGFTGWNCADSGDSKSDPRTLGGGRLYNNDARYVDGSTYTNEGLPSPDAESAIDFINKYNDDKPFCLVVSLVNPHDIWVAPNYDDTDDDKTTGYSYEDGEIYDLPVPENANEDLAFKPDVHTVLREQLRRGDRKDIKDPKVQKNYVGFYAYLKTLVDKEMGKVLDALDAKGLTENTLIIRTADHGELCLAHGLREKPYNAYEQTINVPLIISNPKLFPTAQETDTVVSSIDIMPTLAKIAGIEEQFSFAFRGTDITPLFTNPKDTLGREFVHFVFDDGRLPEELSDIPQLIRTIRSKEWKYSVYFTSDGKKFEYELYNLVKDPNENDNLAGQKGMLEDQVRLHEALEEVLLKLGTLPYQFWFVSEEMEDTGFMPAYHWPTSDEAWTQSLLQYQINKVEHRLAKRKKVRTNRIASVIDNLSPDDLWMIRPRKMEFNT